MATRAPRSSLAPLFSGVLLYVFAGAFSVLASAVVPYLLELMESAIRLAALGWLALLASPVAFIGLAHAATHAVMDRFDAGGADRGARRFANARAGMFGWFAMWFSSMASAFLLLAIFPPPPEETGHGFCALVHVATDVRLEASVHAFLWVGVATLLFWVQGRGTKGEV